MPGTVTVIWEPSPDEKRDDRLHYSVSKLDSTKRTWATVADRLFNNKFTVCNIMLGREYNFRVYAKNDMGISAPSESPTWGVEKKKGVFVHLKQPQRPNNDLFKKNSISPYLLSCRKVCGERTDQKGSRFAMCANLHCTAEASHCTQRLRMLHELRSEGQSQASCHVVSKSHQLKHRYQLLHLQHLRGLLHVNSPRGSQRHGRVHHHCRERPRTG